MYRHLVHRACPAALFLVALASAAPVEAAALPKELGQCSATQVQVTGSRLEGKPESGSFIRYINGGVQVSHEVLPGLLQSRPGDVVRLCLAHIPSDCPAGDERGRIYEATNLRTKRSWRAPNSNHGCGGA